MRLAAIGLCLCLLPLALPAPSLAQPPVPVAPPAPVDGLASQGTLQSRIMLLAQQERELKLQGQPRGFHAQLITAAALGATGSIVGAVALVSALARTQCDCGPSHKLTRGLTIGGYALEGVAGIWAITLVIVRRARTDRDEIRRLHEQRRSLQQQYKSLQPAAVRAPFDLSLRLAPQQLTLRATF
jgi:hypothetical protein